MLIKESVSLNKMLSKQPTLDELCEQFSVISINWYLFGVHFQLENNQLEAIRQLEKKVVYKMLKMFKVLLHVKPSTTRKQIIDALYFMDFFAIAEDYINSLIKAHDRTGKKTNIVVLLVSSNCCVDLACLAQNVYLCFNSLFLDCFFIKMYF